MLYAGAQLGPICVYMLENYISYAVGRLAVFCEETKERRYEAVKMGLRYPAGTIHLCPVFRGNFELGLSA